MATPELKPCPFCGRGAYIADLRNGQYVTCKHADCCMVRPDTFPFSGAPIEKQIDAWNRRANDVTIRDVVAVINKEDWKCEND